MKKQSQTAAFSSYEKTLDPGQPLGISEGGGGGGGCCVALHIFRPPGSAQTQPIDNHNYYSRDLEFTMPTRARALLRILGTLILALCGGLLQATQYSGSVRAGFDQPVPGAMVTAKQGDAKVIAYTDENGRYTMDLAPGAWDISVEMFEFTTSSGKSDYRGHASAPGMGARNAEAS